MKTQTNSCKPKSADGGDDIWTKLSSLLSLFVIEVLSLSHHHAQNLFMVFYQINTMKQETNPTVFLAEWKKDATSLSLTMKLVGHSSQSCSSAEPCQIMTVLAVVPCHKQIQLWPHKIHIWKPSKAQLFQKDVQQVFLLHLRALSWSLDASDAAGESEEFLKIELSSAAMKALSRLEENSGTWFLSWHSTAVSFESLDHTH